jgi:hypothetical protein
MHALRRTIGSFYIYAPHARAQAGQNGSHNPLPRSKILSRYYHNMIRRSMEHSLKLTLKLITIWYSSVVVTSRTIMVSLLWLQLTHEHGQVSCSSYTFSTILSLALTSAQPVCLEFRTRHKRVIAAIRDTCVRLERDKS